MTALHHEIHADADAATVWEAIADFGAVHERFAAGFVTATEVEGEERVVTFANGLVARELRLSTEPDRRRFAYAGGWRWALPCIRPSPCAPSRSRRPRRCAW